MNIKEIIAFVSTALPLAIGLLTFLIKAVKNGKAKKILQQTLEITQALQPLIIKAEEFSHYTGLEKKQYVLTAANQFALDNKLNFDTSKVSGLIDTLVDTTKRVNMRETDKVKLRAQTQENLPIMEQAKI